MTNLRKLGWLAGLCLLVFATGTAQAGGGGGGGSLCAGFAESISMTMRDNCFEGTANFVPAGSTISVYNEGNLPHSLTAVDGSFDTGTLQSGQRAEFTVGAEGIIRYYCVLHGTASGSGMAGVIIAGEQPASSAVTRQPAWASIWGWLGGGLGGAAFAVLIFRFRPR